MIIYALTNGQKTLVTVISVLLFILFIYLLILFAKRNFKKSKETKMLTLNMVVKSKVFNQYVNYKIDTKEEYILYLVSINNFNQLTKLYKDSIITTYLKRLGKNLSIYLPFGGKLAQTKQRDTFIIYIPKSANAADFGTLLQNVANELYVVNGIMIKKSISVSYLDTNYNDLNKSYEYLANTLIESKRRLGEVLLFDESYLTSISDYSHQLELLNNSKITITPYEVHSIKTNNNDQTYMVIKINEQSFYNFINQVSSKDQAWVNMWIIQFLLTNYSNNKQISSINLPVSTKTLEENKFITELNKIIDYNQFNFRDTNLVLVDIGFNNERDLISNILELKNYGYKISYQVKTINQELYQIIQSYHIDRLELPINIFENKSDELDELLYFIKVNNLEVMVKNTTSNINSFSGENITHVTKKTSINEFIQEDETRRRGRK